MKYFVISDIHSFYTEMCNALNKAGFEYNNPNHSIILCGDLFDRGPDAVKVLGFMRDLGNRLIYVKGNHETLLEDCIAEINKFGYVISPHHRSNGTVDTISQLTGLNYFALTHYITPEEIGRINAIIRPIIEWIKNKSVYYAELGDYIFVHGWIPHVRDGNLEDVSPLAWEEAMWGNGMEEWHNGWRIPGKTIVCGHFHASWGWSHLRQKRQEFPQKNKKDFLKSFEPFVDDGIIAIDACTAYSGIVNCITIDVEEEENEQSR